MSLSSPTVSASRSPSPHTPDPSDTQEPVAVQADFDAVAAWFIPLNNHKPAMPWDTDPALFAQPRKLDDEQMLRIDDLLEQHAFDECVAVSDPVSAFPAYPPTSPAPAHFAHGSPPTNLLVPSLNGPISVTKPIPPPASLPRKIDAVAHNQRVVHPPKETCFNLPIMFPSIPEGGTKSRVETQVRVTVDLADANSSSDPHKYDRIGSWKWLKLPPGTSTKRRTRKQGKIDASPQDTLNLITEVVCASAPTVPVVSCSSCRTREAKRVAKKIAARVRPARSDSDSAGEDTFGKPVKKPAHEDTNSIIQFNCAEVLDFSTGSVVLPLRITCYCRHHREKVGFLVRFTMMDHVGRVVGTGISRPVMITDDHKTASATNRSTDYVNTFSQPEPEWPRQISPIGNEASPPSDLRGPTRRKDKVNGTAAKRRPKPYDSAAKPGRGSREGSMSSLPSPSTTYSPLPLTRSPTPSVLQNLLTASEAVPKIQSQSQTPNMPTLQPSIQSSDTSSPDILSTPLDHNSDVHIPEIVQQMEQDQQPSAIPVPLPLMPQPLPTLSNMQQPQSQVSSPIPQPTPAMLLSQASASTAAPLPFLFFEPNQTNQNLVAIQMPTIHRLIPNVGPTFGGIEVTVLGANFHANLNLRCIFGEVVASSTQRWSDNTLVCLLPPRAQPGVVAVWFEGILEHLSTPSSLFTYSDESDRALMELALQVVGLKMTGKIEDAKNVAMRIVGGNTAGDNQDSRSGNGVSSLMQLATSAPSLNRDFRSLLFIRAGETENFESTVVDFLSILDTPLDQSSAPCAIPTVDAISHTTATGQTLLHLAAFMKLPALVDFLVKHEADVDARDKNGFTPLHFAVLAKSVECAKVLVQADADREIVNYLGKTAEEIAEPGIRRLLRRRASKRALRKTPASSGDSKSDDTSSSSPPNEKSKADMVGVDVDVDPKQTASIFADLIQRTLAQLPNPATGILPKNLPGIPKPQLPTGIGFPNLPDFGNVAMPWNALPQIPMVFPVFVPTPAWPSFLGGSDESGNEKGESEEKMKTLKTGDDVDGAKGDDAETKAPNAREWRAMWEKWLALAIATTAKQQQQQGQVQEAEDVPPPEYTPRAEDVPVNGGDASTVKGKGKAKAPQATDAREDMDVLRSEKLTVASAAATPGPSRPQHTHPVGYDDTPIPVEEVDAYAYQPPVKQKQKQKHKKHDRMLLLFWLPILLLSMMWAFHHGLRFAYTTLRTSLPLKAYMRGNA
ncbi:Protein MGA2 [Leucoagaricus sp. SymC.cos]|nr:Protein MGA2 [Leucoagaricus sp. SymC.cos]